MASGTSQGSWRNPSRTLSGAADSMECASTASHRAGVLDGLLADAMSQDQDNMHDMHMLPGGLDLAPREQQAGMSNRLMHEGAAEVHDLESGLTMVRPGSSRASLVARYLQRGRAAAHKAASSAARRGD